MIDFENSSVLKLKEAERDAIGPMVEPLMVSGENVVACFKAMRDYVIFTDKRLIAVNVHFTSLPYSKIQAWSVETAGSFDLDAELDLWFSGLGKVRLEFKGNADIRGLGQLIAHYVL